MEKVVATNTDTTVDSILAEYAKALQFTADGIEHELAPHACCVEDR